jgi:hypothetical protein
MLRQPAARSSPIRNVSNSRWQKAQAALGTAQNNPGRILWSAESTRVVTSRRRRFHLETWALAALVGESGQVLSRWRLRALAGVIVKPNGLWPSQCYQSMATAKPR